MFRTTVTTGDSPVVEQIQQLRTGGLSLSKIAEQTGSTVAVVRRIVGKVDQEARRERQEAIAGRIDAEPLAWDEKVARWRAETGQCEATFWRVLKRAKP
jgi:hypothetical protein